MDEQKRTEIVPLDRELYKDLSIDDLEQRLELSLWCIVDCDVQCGVQCSACALECALDGCANM